MTGLSWKVLYREGVGKEDNFLDMRSKSISIGPRFLDEMLEKIKENTHYDAQPLGIKEIVPPTGKSTKSSDYYVLCLKLSDCDFKVLMKITEGEHSNIVGVTEKDIDPNFLRKALDRVAKGQGVKEIKMII
ncbi:MAG: hypothetical protein GOU99_03055 [Candidatus Altiarchaeota archaeon]|nr:hypothetical protein [Candidatus Altiarchaeota archaeon]